jgi:type II secretory pathway pseudopilin PulG
MTRQPNRKDLMRKPSPAMIVALFGLFFSLAGFGMASTSVFTLGTTNHVDAATKVTNVQSNRTTVNPVDGPLLTLENSSATANATPLSLRAAANHAPFKVSTAVKVANLNADMLDGLDSTSFQRRLTGSCASGTAIRSVTGTGSVTCQDSGTTSVLQHGCTVGGPSLNFTSHGGPLLVILSGSGFRSNADGPGLIQITGHIDNDLDSIADASVYTNETLSHKALVTGTGFTPTTYVPTPAAGTHTFDVRNESGTFDSSDVCRVTIIEFPH